MKLVAISLFALVFSGLAWAEDNRPCQDYRLSDDQLSQVKNGELVQLQEDVEDSDWPRVFTFQRVDSTPEEAMAVFMDANRQPSYLGDVGLVSASVSKPFSKGRAEVDYHYEKDKFINEYYTVTNVISTQDNGKTYKLDWDKVKASSNKEIQGNVCFKPLGTGTLMAYYNFVRPGRFGAGFFTGRAIDEMVQTTHLIAQEIERVRKDDQKLLQKELDVLRAALNDR